MEIKGKVTHVLPEQSGEGRNGTWRKQSYVVEMPGTYPKSVCFDIWGNNIDAFGIKMDEELTVSIDIESREYNGKWFTNVKAWKVERAQPPAAGVTGAAPSNDPSSWPTPADEVKTSDDQSFDDLPF